jgi:hypothetical protein
MTQMAAFMALQTVPATKEETEFRHSAWAHKRAQVLATLLAVNTSPQIVERFQACGAQAVVEWSDAEQRYRVRCDHCHNRHCEPCARAKAQLLALNLRERLDRPPEGRYRFITLTIAHTDKPLTDQLKHLQQSFTRLRKTKLWKSSQKGGAAIIEVKYDRETGEWHPHLHVVAEGQYLRQADLSDAWFSVTGDSRIVDIRRLDSGKDAAHYVAKYVSKGTTDSVWADPNAAQEWVIASKGLRSAATFGTWRGYRLLKKPPTTEGWKRIASLNRIYQDAMLGESWAIRVLNHLRENVAYNPNRTRTPKKQQE